MNDDLHEQGTLFEVTTAFMSSPGDMDSVLKQVARLILERHRYRQVRVYLSHDAGSSKIAHQSFEDRQVCIERMESSLIVAAPIQANLDVLGVLVVSVDSRRAIEDRLLSFCRALTYQLAIGIQYVGLHHHLTELSMLVNRILDGLRADVERPAIESLSGREKEVLAMVVEWKTNKQIAESLVISENTVRNHVGSILHKLKLDSRYRAAELFRHWKPEG